MGKLHDQMRDELLLKAYSPHSLKAYFNCEHHFVRYYMHSPQGMGEQEVRDFLLHLVRDRKASPTQDMYVNALKFLYTVTLKRPEVVKHISHPKRPQTVMYPPSVCFAQVSRPRSPVCFCDICPTYAVFSPYFLV
jgi:integrase/recombinase XerD